jgi:DNA-binding NarL/FixJ family response regulator
MMGRRRASGPLDELSPRDREVLKEIAEGKSNRGIAAALFISEAAVEKHVTAIFRKLEIEPAANDHRRVLAVVRYLRECHPSHPSSAREHASASRSPLLPNR